MAIEAIGQFQLGIQREDLEVIGVRGIPRRRPRPEVTALALRIGSLTRRLTPQRLAIFKYLARHPGHPTAEEVYRDVLERYPTLSFATVYNTLELLAEMGEVRMVIVDELRRAAGDPDVQAYDEWRRFAASGGPFDFDRWFEHAREALGPVAARVYAHNVLGHGFHLTEDLVRTPLVIVDRERCAEGAVRDELRSQADLFATLLDLAGIEDHAAVLERSFLRAAPPTLVYVEANGQVAFRYCNPDGEFGPEHNPNGSARNIVGIFNRTKNVLGMMPHPENAIEPLQGSTDGKALFKSMVEALS